MRPQIEVAGGAAGSQYTKVVGEYRGWEDLGAMFAQSLLVVGPFDVVAGQADVHDSVVRWLGGGEGFYRT